LRGHGQGQATPSKRKAEDASSNSYSSGSSRGHVGELNAHSGATSQRQFLQQKCVSFAPSQRFRRNACCSGHESKNSAVETPLS
jgi:hypothetical protein